MWFEGPFRLHVLVEWVVKNPSLPSSFQEVDYVNPTRRSKAKLVGVKNQVLCGFLFYISPLRAISGS